MRQEDNIVVGFMRFGEEPRDISLHKDATLSEAFDELCITDITATETVWVNGVKVEAYNEAILDDGDQISIVGKKQGGLK
jgi:sulfur carrier protein ThiS